MGGSCSTLPSMTEIDFESYQGHRYSTEVPNTRDATHGAASQTETIALDESKLTMYEILLKGAAVDNGTRALYGTRAINADGTRGEYEWLTYNEVMARTDVIAAGLAKFTGLQRKSMVGIFSKNRVEWCLSAHACDRMSYVLVPVYDTLGPDAVPYIVNHTEQTLLICAKEQFDTVLKCKDTCPTLQYIVKFEELTQEQRQRAEAKGVQVKSFREIEELGKIHPLPADPPSPEDISTISYTSGTTGNPKGVTMLHKHLAVLTVMYADHLRLTQDTVYISYLPLPHVLERCSVSTVVGIGGSIGFYSGDVLKLMDDMAILKPTCFITVPRLLNRIYDRINQKASTAGGVSQFLFNRAYSSKQASLVDGYKTHIVWDRLVFSKIRAMLGGRVEFVLSAAAPLRAEVKDFVKVVLSCDIIEGFGMTEVSGGVVMSTADMPLGAHVGAPLPNFQVRLEDVPEMGYTSKDQPHPRGEITIKGPSVFAGYYKDPKMTAEVFDKDGWLHTGGIGCWNADGTLCVIDRKKNIFKLSQGEYVAAEKIENIFAKSKYVAQIFVYGDSFQTSLVAIAVPDPDVAQVWATSRGLSDKESTLEMLVQDPDFQKEIMEDITRVGKEKQLRGFVFIKKIHLHAEPFGLEQGLITPTFKLKRPQLKVHFQSRLTPCTPRPAIKGHKFSVAMCNIITNNSISRRKDLMFASLLNNHIEATD